MAEPMGDSQILDYFEGAMRGFIVERLSGTDNWWDSCIPPEIREEAARRYAGAKKINDVLNKPDYSMVEYINFDGYGRIITRRDNWRDHFEGVFGDKPIFEHKIRIIGSLRNDIRHGRRPNHINEIRLRLHCYDILAQVYESGRSGADDHDALAAKLGLLPED